MLPVAGPVIQVKPVPRQCSPWQLEEANRDGKSGWHWRIVLPRSRPSGAGPVVSGTPWGLARAVELRGIAVAAGGRADRVQPLPRGERLLRGFQAGLDGQLSRRGPRCDDVAAPGSGYRDRRRRAAVPERPLCPPADPEGNPIELWQPAGPGARP